MPRVRSAAEERLSEVAGLLAVGILRLLSRKSQKSALPTEQVRVDFSPRQSVCGTDVTEKETAR